MTCNMALLIINIVPIWNLFPFFSYTIKQKKEIEEYLGFTGKINRKLSTEPYLSLQKQTAHI